MPTQSDPHLPNTMRRSKDPSKPGKLADLVVLSDDIFTIQPEAIENTRVDMTIFDGKVIYQR
jgi:hypothetical protein